MSQNTAITPESMDDERRKRVQAIQTSMLESECVRSVFEDPQRDHLRGLIRLTVEFYYYLEVGYPDWRPKLKTLVESHGLGGNIEIELDDLERGYAIASIFSGIDSFVSISGLYCVLVGAKKSKLQWGNFSAHSFEDQFVAMFHDFEAEDDFIKKCRLLLDLFKLQIVFAGMYYDD